MNAPDLSPLVNRRYDVNLTSWKRDIPRDAWSDAIPEDGVFSRSTVFAAASDWRDQRLTARQLLAVTYMWGAGRSGYGSTRCRKILKKDPGGSNLAFNLEPLQQESPATDDLVAAYERFGPTSTTRVRGLGPAFFTKLLYFVGYRRRAGGVQPLVLDRYVAVYLRESGVMPSLPRWGWSSETWLAYLRWAAEESGKPGFEGEPDAVEEWIYLRPGDRT